MWIVGYDALPWKIRDLNTVLGLKLSKSVFQNANRRALDPFSSDSSGSNLPSDCLHVDIFLVKEWQDFQGSYELCSFFNHRNHLFHFFLPDLSSNLEHRVSLGFVHWVSLKLQQQAAFQKKGLNSPYRYRHRPLQIEDFIKVEIFSSSPKKNYPCFSLNLPDVHHWSIPGLRSGGWPTDRGSGETGKACSLETKKQIRATLRL